MSSNVLSDHRTPSTSYLTAKMNRLLHRHGPAPPSQPLSASASANLASSSTQDLPGPLSASSIHHHQPSTPDSPDTPGHHSIKEVDEDKLEDNPFDDDNGDDGKPNADSLSHQMINAMERCQAYTCSMGGRQWRKPESCSSFGSLNNTNAPAQPLASTSLDDDSGQGHTAELNRQCSACSNCSQQTSPSGGTGNDGDLPGTPSFRPPINYARKYSLTVPGEPRHMRILNRRESSGSRSPLNSSYGGLSTSELSTPSRSISNSINDDQSSCSSGALNALIINSPSLSRKCCTLSVDSLLLLQKPSQQQPVQVAPSHPPPLAVCQSKAKSSSCGSKPTSKLSHSSNRLEDLCKRLLSLNTGGRHRLADPSSSQAIDQHLASDEEHDHAERPDKLAGLSKHDEKESSKSTAPHTSRRRDSFTAMIASLLLPDSLCQRIGTASSFTSSNDPSHPHESSPPTKARVKHDPGRRTSLFTSSKSPKLPPLTALMNDHVEQPSSSSGRRSSIVQLTSASAGKIVRLLRRTHSAGAHDEKGESEPKEDAPRHQHRHWRHKERRGHSQQAPSHALFLVKGALEKVGTCKSIDPTIESLRSVITIPVHAEFKGA